MSYCYELFDYLFLSVLVMVIDANNILQEKHLAASAISTTSMAWNLSPRMAAIERSQADIHTEVSTLRKDTS